MNFYGVKAIYKFEMARAWRTLMQSIASRYSPPPCTLWCLVPRSVHGWVKSTASATEPTSSLAW